MNDDSRFEYHAPLNLVEEAVGASSPTLVNNMSDRMAYTQAHKPSLQGSSLSLGNLAIAQYFGVTWRWGHQGPLIRLYNSHVNMTPHRCPSCRGVSYTQQHNNITSNAPENPSEVFLR